MTARLADFPHVSMTHYRLLPLQFLPPMIKINPESFGGPGRQIEKLDASGNCLLREMEVHFFDLLVITSDGLGHLHKGKGLSQLNLDSFQLKGVIEVPIFKIKTVLSGIGEDDLCRRNLIDISLRLHGKVEVEIVPRLLEVDLPSDTVFSGIIGGHRQSPASEFFIEVFQIGQCPLRCL